MMTRTNLQVDTNDFCGCDASDFGRKVLLFGKKGCFCAVGDLDTWALCVVGNREKEVME